MGSSASVLKDSDAIPLEIRNLLDMCEIQLNRILENDHDIINREMSKIFKKHTDIIAAVTSHTKGQLKKLYSSNTNSNPFGLYALLALGNNYAYVYKMLFMSKDNIENHSFKISAQAEYDEGILKSILGTSTSKEIKQFRIIYETERRVSLIDVVKLRAGLNTPIQKFLIKILKADRSDDDIVNREAAIAQAKEIHKAGASRFFGVEEDPIFDILSKASRAQCVAISEEYVDSFKMTLSSALKKKFGGNIGKLLLLWILPVDCAVATLIKNACSKLITNAVAIIRIITKYDKPFLAQVDQACFKLFGSNLLTIVGKALSGNVFKAIKGWLENPSPDSGTENDLDEFIAKKKSEGCTNDDIFNDPDCVDVVKGILQLRSDAFEKYMYENKIPFQFDDRSMAALHEMNSAAVEQSNRRRSSDVNKRPKLVQTTTTPTTKGNNMKHMKNHEEMGVYDEKAKKVASYLQKEFAKFDDDKVGVFVTEDFWYIVKTLPLSDLGLSVEEVDFMSANCDWEVKGHINYHDAIIELTDGIINSIEEKSSDSDVFTVIRRLYNEDNAAERRHSQIAVEAERVETHKKKQKKPKKEKLKLPPNVENFIFDTFDSFDYDCKGYLDSFEMEKFIEASNIQLPLSTFYCASDDVYTHEDVTKVFAKEIDKVLTVNIDPMYLCFMDKDSGAYFWYNVLDASTKWVTESEVVENTTSSSRRYIQNQGHVVQAAVHYLPQDDYDDSNQYLGDHNTNINDETVSEDNVGVAKEEEIIKLTEEEKLNGKKVLSLWLTEGVKLSADLIDAYTELLVSAGMTSSSDVGSRIEKNSNILQSLGISNPNVARIQQALIKEKVSKLSLSSTGVSSVSIDILPTPTASKTTLPDLPEVKKEENIDEKDLCLICFENRKCMVFFPCGHLCVCESCDIMMNRKQGVLCIMCRVEIQNRAKLFNT